MIMDAGCARPAFLVMQGIRYGRGNSMKNTKAWRMQQERGDKIVQLLLPHHD